jgi:hypothetical protein
MSSGIPTRLRLLIHPPEAITTARARVWYTSPIQPSAILRQTPNPTASLPEDLIGVWFTGNPTVRLDGVEVAGVQAKGPADNIEIKPGRCNRRYRRSLFLVTIEELRAELLRHAVGEPLAIRYRHGRLTSENYLILGSKDTIPQR